MLSCRHAQRRRGPWPRRAPARVPTGRVPQHAERSTAEVLHCARVRETKEKNRKEDGDDKWGLLVVERR